MFKLASSVLVLAAAVAWASPLDETVNEADFARGSVITRDVAILGGGASGSYAAVRLREDLGHSVVVVEAKSRLGGHVATYDDPMTGRPIDFGVSSYIDIGGARAFFKRMGVSTSGPTRVLRTNVYADFRTGEAVPAWVSPNNTAALGRYLELCRQYQDLLFPSYAKFPPPGKIPEDLLMSFGEFAVKHGLEAALPQIFQVTGMGTGTMLELPTLYVMQAFGAPMALALQPTTGLGFVPASRNNSELYGKVAQLLGGDVLFSSRVLQAERRPSLGVRLVVRRGDGGRVLIRAKRLLVAMEPTMQALENLGIDNAERAVFGKWQYSRNYVGVVTHPALPAGVSIINTRNDSAPANYMAVLKDPYVVRFEHYGDPTNLYRVLMVGRKWFTADQAKAMVQSAFEKLVASGVVPGKATKQKVKFIDFADHRAMHLHVSRKELERGFLQKQSALQGHRSTWWTGAAWTSQFTNAVWAFTDEILPRLDRELKWIKTVDRSVTAS